MRFEFRFDAVSRPLLGALGVGRRRSWVEVASGSFRVRMGWAFRLDAPAGAIGSAEEVEEPIPALLGVGVHGWARRWAVNGARRPHVIVRFAAPQLAYTMGFPVWVDVLHLAPADPAGLIEALHG
jgi:hypothetical protein